MLGSLFMSITLRFRWIRELLRTPLTAFGTIIVFGFLLLALFGSHITPYSYDENAFNNFDLLPYTEPDCFSKDPIHVPLTGIKFRTFAPHSAECNHVFGTDDLGYDVFSRVILGTREIFRLAGLGTLFAVLIGTAVGLLIGYQGGLVDEVVSRLLDSLLSIPALLLSLILLGTLPSAFKLHAPALSLEPSFPLVLPGTQAFALNSLSVTSTLAYMPYEISTLIKTLVLVVVLISAPTAYNIVRSRWTQMKYAPENANLPRFMQLRLILADVIPALSRRILPIIFYGILILILVGLLFRLQNREYTLDLLENSILIVLIIVYAPIVARVVRSNVLSIKTRGFVEAAQLRGESTAYILWREILPSVIPSLVVEASLRFSYGIFLVASLGFLGQGAEPPTPNWGLMMNVAYKNQDYICNEFQCRSWTLLYPALAIVLLVISVNLMSDGIKRLAQRND